MSTLQKAIDALQSGQQAAALGLLKQALTENPQDPTAWVWLARALDDPARKRECLQRALRLDPTHAFARKTLSELEGPAPQAQPAQPAPRPAPAAPAETGRVLRPQTPITRINDALLNAPPAPPAPTPPQPVQAPAAGGLLDAAAYLPEEKPQVFSEPSLPAGDNAVFSAAAAPTPAAVSAAPAAFTLSSNELENYMNAELVEEPPAPAAPPRPTPAAAAAKRPAARQRRAARRPSRGQQVVILLLALLVLALIAVVLVWLF